VVVLAFSRVPARSFDAFEQFRPFVRSNLLDRAENFRDAATQG
jgi:hypothetical protein